MTRDEVLVDVAELANVGPAEGWTLLDVRWRLGDDAGAGAARYAAGHLPGAVFLDLEQVLTRHTGDPRDGRHPLPDPAHVTAALADLGVWLPRPGRGRPVVVYDEAGSFAAARAWWVLSWVGVPTRVLDGGIEAWVAAGLALESGPAASARSRVAADLPLEAGSAAPVSAGPGESRSSAARAGMAPGALPTLDADAAARLPDLGILVDVRAPERYRGESEPLDPVAGHIPGAVNLPVSALFAAEGTLADEATLRRELAPAVAAAAEGRPVGVYCGSGVSAAHTVLALRTLGVAAALYPGSWSAWCHDPRRPVARA